ncbi:hypothetical protein [Leptospira interrogans]|uniref:hypothetical protein n=1 Tax=Leptospira interrogans TaxID=173 RepID=UPI00077410C1|nr:hypothetical protein [Leptospira interrogans]
MWKNSFQQNESTTETYFNLGILYSRTRNKSGRSKVNQRFIEAKSRPAKYKKSQQDARAKTEELKKVLLVGKNIELESGPGSAFL